VKSLLKLHLNIQNTLAADTDKRKLLDEESTTKFKWNNYNAFMAYLKNKSREATDPENPINKAKKKLARLISKLLIK